MSSKGKRKPPGKQQTSTKSSPTSKKQPANDLPEALYLITCDIPTKQYILYLNEIKSKKFIAEELDDTHLLIAVSAKAEIEQAIDTWMDENVFSAIEKVGEDLDIS